MDSLVIMDMSKDSTPALDHHGHSRVLARLQLVREIESSGASSATFLSAVGVTLNTFERRRAPSPSWQKGLSAHNT